MGLKTPQRTSFVHKGAQRTTKEFDMSTKDLKFISKHKNIVIHEEKCKKKKINFNKNCDFNNVRFLVTMYHRYRFGTDFISGLSDSSCM